MNTRTCVLLAILAVPLAASAEPAPAVRGTSSAAPQIAIAVNPPLRWSEGDAVGASVYAGFGTHHAIRANVASYKYGANIAGDLISVANGGDGDEALHEGRITDAGLAWMYFPRRLWSGLTLETGLLVRSRDTRTEDDFAPIGIVETQTRTVSARALVGWSWFFYDRAFLSIAVGSSVGREFGSERRSARTYDPMFTQHDVSRMAHELEGFMRLGVAFDR